MRVKIDGVVFDFRYVLRVDKNNAWGHIDPPQFKKRRILIKEGLEPVDELNTIIHEFLHAIDWNKDEQWVDERSLELAKLLLRLGYEK